MLIIIIINANKSEASSKYFGLEIENYKSGKEISGDMIADRAKYIFDYMRKSGDFVYQSSNGQPVASGWIKGPCADIQSGMYSGKGHAISCDRLAASVLWSYGFTDQWIGGFMCNWGGTPGIPFEKANLDYYLTHHGFEKSTNTSDIKRGSIVTVKGGGHCFIVESWNGKTLKRYDTGNDSRIRNEAYPIVTRGIPYNLNMGIAIYNASGTSEDLYKVIFNYDYYVKRYPRIKEKFKDDKQKALEYFLNTGIKKGQVASPVFDINYYINHNSDLKEKFGNDLEKYYKHFEEQGMKEGRRASEEFKVYDYRDLNPKLKEKFGNNLPKYYIHYVEVGWKKGLKAVKQPIIYLTPKVEKVESYGESLDDVIENAESFIKLGNSKITQSNIQNFSQIIYNILLSIGIVVSVITGSLIGIKLMTSGVSEKAETQKLIVPYIIGCVVVFGGFSIWKIAVTILQNI